MKEYSKNMDIAVINTALKQFLDIIKEQDIMLGNSLHEQEREVIVGAWKAILYRLDYTEGI